MKYLHAALLLHDSGKKITVEAISKIIAAAGAKADEARVKGLISVLENVDIEEAIKSAPMMAAAPAAAAPSSKSTKAAAPAAEEEEEEQGEDLGLESLFGWALG